MIGVGLLGLGTVGTGIVEILEDRKKELEELLGEPVVIRKILVLNKKKPRKLSTDRYVITTDFKDLINDKDIQIILEATGDQDRAYRYLKEALIGGKHVVSANKALVSKHLEELSLLAEEKGLAFLYEASVAGGIPVLKALKDQLRLNRINMIGGIVNGTCNYILTRMEDEGLDYSQALKEAQEIGYAELDPRFDVEGLDSLRKLRILASLALQTKVGEEDILLEGIERISKLDLELANKLGRRFKLVATARRVEGGFEALVMPSLLKKESQLSGVCGAYNMVELTGDKIGSLSFYGLGAGGLPTANAVLSDLLDIAVGAYPRKSPLGQEALTSLGGKLEASFYLRINKYNCELEQAFKPIIEELLFSGTQLVVLTKKLPLKEIYYQLESKSISKKDYFLARLEV